VEIIVQTSVFEIVVGALLAAPCFATESTSVVCTPLVYAGYYDRIPAVLVRES
jgi:hypothetical protein